MKCPKCGYQLIKDDGVSRIHLGNVEQACTVTGFECTMSTKRLITRLIHECSDEKSETLIQFINKIKPLPLDVIHNTINYFFAMGYADKGFRWQYCVGMMVNKSSEKQRRDKWLNPIPKET